MNTNFSKLDLWTGKTLGILVLSLLQMVLLYQTTYFIYHAFGLSGQSYLTILAGQTFVGAIQSVIPLPGGVGVADGGFYLILNSMFGSENINFALVMWRLLSFYLPILTGVFLLFTDKRKEKKHEHAPHMIEPTESRFCRLMLNPIKIWRNILFSSFFWFSCFSHTHRELPDPFSLDTGLSRFWHNWEPSGPKGTNSGSVVQKNPRDGYHCNLFLHGSLP